MESFIQQVINGISLGSIFALIALGYTMVYGIIGLINFAHGDILMIGAYVGFAVTSYTQLGFFPALILAMAVCTVLGVLIEKIAYKPLRNATRIAALITAIGVSFFLEYTTMYFVGADKRGYVADVLSNKVFHIGDILISMQQIYIIVITIVLMVALQFIVHKTKVGKAMRAVSIDKNAAQLMGISVNRTISYTFAIGSALAGAAGVLFGIYYTSINPLMGMTPGLKAFVAAVFGGIGSIPGAMVGGLTMGVAETMVSGYVPNGSLFKDAVVYGILLLVLIIKPSGLLGRNTKEKV